MNDKTSSSKLRRVSVKLIMMIGLLAYALLFGEVFLRLLNPQALVPRYVTGGPDGIRANMPGATFHQHTPELEVKIHYNDAGMRDDRPAPTIDKAQGECRIALLGDSFMVGFESDWVQSYGMQLETQLKERGVNCRVLNFAVSGFGHAEMLIALKSRVSQWKPNLIIASINRTDGLDNVRCGLFDLSADGVLERNKKEYLPGIKIGDRLYRSKIYRWLDGSSQLYSAIRSKVTIIAKQLMVWMRSKPAAEAPRLAAEEAEEEGAPTSAQGDVRLNRALMTAMIAQSQQLGAQILFLDIPANEKRARYHTVANDFLGPDFYAQLPHIDLMRRFDELKLSNAKLYTEQGHRHWTELGNREAAKVSVDQIIAGGLLPLSPAK